MTEEGTLDTLMTRKDALFKHNPLAYFIACTNDGVSPEDIEDFDLYQRGLAEFKEHKVSKKTRGAVAIEGTGRWAHAKAMHQAREKGQLSWGEFVSVLANYAAKNGGISSLNGKLQGSISTAGSHGAEEMYRFSAKFGDLSASYTFIDNPNADNLLEKTDELISDIASKMPSREIVPGDLEKAFDEDSSAGVEQDFAESAESDNMQAIVKYYAKLDERAKKRFPEGERGNGIRTSEIDEKLRSIKGAAEDKRLKLDAAYRLEVKDFSKWGREQKWQYLQTLKRVIADRLKSYLTGN